MRNSMQCRRTAGRLPADRLAGRCSNFGITTTATNDRPAVLELDPAAKSARVEPGIILDGLRNEAEKHTLPLGPDPATHNRCTIGGMIGNNSCGVHALMAGK